MKVLNIKGNSGSSVIAIGEKIKNIGKYLPDDKVVIVSDNNVVNYYGKDFPEYPVIQIGTGEKIKTLSTLENIFTKLVENEVDRSYFILGIGGGIVCDIAGLAASTYMRGVRFGFVSSTLLGQVDASVGGKNGVNFLGYKNMIGVFNQPEFVICDMGLLKTLPKEELLCGMAEIVKYGVISHSALFSHLENNFMEAISLNPDIIEKLVYESVLIKSNIVNRDEKEKGERKKLNFGHTIGHAVEKISDLKHGQAISIGMLTAAALSQKKGYLSLNDVRRLRILLDNLGLPTSFACDTGEILNAIKKDKKRKGDVIEFILLQEIGNALVQSIPIDELCETLQASGTFDD